MTNVFYVNKDGIPHPDSEIYLNKMSAMDAAFNLQEREIIEISPEELLKAYTKLQFIKRYLESDKFMNDIMVNKNDILLRLMES